MMRRYETYDTKVRAYLVEASFADFDGDLVKWREAFYEMWRYQLTFSFAYDIRLAEVKDGVYIKMIVRENYVMGCTTSMTDLGYKNIRVNKVYVGIVYALDRDDMEDIEALSLDY